MYKNTLDEIYRKFDFSETMKNFLLLSAILFLTKEGEAKLLNPLNLATLGKYFAFYIFSIQNSFATMCASADCVYKGIEM